MRVALDPAWCALAGLVLVGCAREPAITASGRADAASERLDAPASTAVTVASPAPSSEPPPGLACLARHYVGAPLREGDRWMLALPDGARVAWDDGRKKTAAETLDAPDLEDMLATDYRAGPIAPVTEVDRDPGRARVEALFDATYGATEKEVRAALVPWKLRGHTFLVHRRALPAFERVRVRIDAAVAKDAALAPFFDHPAGTFAFRAIAGTTRKSTHSFGVAVDLDPSRAHYWRNDAKPQWKNLVPQAIVDAFEAEGFVWGGRWWHYDTMHFEWRPELFDCR